MKLKIVPYNKHSKSAKELRTLLKIKGYNCKIVQRDSLTYISRYTHKILNWGCADSPSWNTLNINHWINKPWDVKKALNKLDTFELLNLHNIPTPEWTTDYDVAQQWALDGTIVIGRRTLTGTGGKGIEICNPTTSWEDSQYSTSNDDLDSFSGCPLYVKYKKKKKEFRIHVFNGKVIDAQQKKKRADQEVTSSKIRNHMNGWVFCREDITIPEDLHALAITAVSALRLTFGAVDIIWNEKENKSYVLEVNTAPGLEGQTINSYTNAILEYLNEIN